MTTPTAIFRIFAPGVGAAALRITIGWLPLSALAAAYALLHPNYAVESVLAAATIAIAIFPLLRRARPAAFHALEPIVPAALLLAALFGARPLAMIGTDEFFFRGYDLEPTFRQAVLLGFLGTTAFVAAYELMQSRPLQSIRQDAATPRLNRAYAFLALAAFAGVTLFAVHLARGPSILESLRLMLRGRSDELAAVYAQSSEYLSSAPLLIACAAIVFAASSRACVFARLDWVAMAAAAIAPALVFVLLGNRRFVIPCLLIPVVVLFLVRRRRPPIVPIAVLAPVVFIILATIPYARSAGAREQAGGVVPIFRDAFVHPMKPWSRFVHGPDTEALSALAVELRVLSKPADFFYGRATVGDVVIAPIPSMIVPGKPTTARDQMLIRAFGRPCVVRTGGSCPNFSVIGTFYQDFWLGGVVVGMALLGLVSAALWRTHLRRSGSLFAAVAAGCWTVFLPILIRAGFMPPFAWFLYFLVPSSIGLLVVLHRNEAQPTA